MQPDQLETSNLIQKKRPKKRDFSSLLLKSGFSGSEKLQKIFEPSGYFGSVGGLLVVFIGIELNVLLKLFKNNNV